jgi:hypothetical protein
MESSVITIEQHKQRVRQLKEQYRDEALDACSKSREEGFHAATAAAENRTKELRNLCDSRGEQLLQLRSEIHKLQKQNAFASQNCSKCANMSSVVSTLRKEINETRTQLQEAKSAAFAATNSKNTSSCVSASQIKEIMNSVFNALRAELRDNPDAVFRCRRCLQVLTGSLIAKVQPSSSSSVETNVKRSRIDRSMSAAADMMGRSVDAALKNIKQTDQLSNTNPSYLGTAGRSFSEPSTVDAPQTPKTLQASRGIKLNLSTSKPAPSPSTAIRSLKQMDQQQVKVASSPTRRSPVMLNALHTPSASAAASASATAVSFASHANAKTMLSIAERCHDFNAFSSPKSCNRFKSTSTAASSRGLRCIEWRRIVGRYVFELHNSYGLLSGQIPFHVEPVNRPNFSLI